MESLAESQHLAVHGQNVSKGRGFILLVGCIHLIIAGFMLLANLGTQTGEPDLQRLLPSMLIGIIGIVFLALWVWAKHAPFAASLSALVIYITLTSLDFLMAPEMAARGIIIKIAIVIALANSVKSGYALRRQ